MQGRIHKCSKAYNSAYLESYEGHYMAVYTVRATPNPNPNARPEPQLQHQQAPSLALTLTSPSP